MYTLIWGVVGDSHGVSSAQLEEFFQRMLNNGGRVTVDVSKGSFKVAKDFASLDGARGALKSITRAYPHQAFWEHINYDWQDIVDEAGDTVYCEECGDSAVECKCKSESVKAPA